MVKYLYAVSIFFVSFFFSNDVLASHGQGADISYECLRKWAVSYYLSIL
jgi:hypothetical protein